MESKRRQPSQHHTGHRNLVAQSGCHCWLRVWFRISLNQLKWLFFLPRGCTLPSLASVLAFIWLLFVCLSPLLRLLWACSYTGSLPGCQAGAAFTRAGTHSQGQAEVLPADTPAHFALACHQPWLWLWHSWPDGHLTHQRRETLAAILRRNQDHSDSNWVSEVSSFLLLFHAIDWYQVPFGEVAKSHHRSPGSQITGQIVMPHLQVRAFKEWQSEPDPMKSVLADQKRSTPGKSLQCLHACPSCQAIMLRSCSEPGEWVITSYVSLERASPFLFPSEDKRHPFQVFSCSKPFDSGPRAAPPP